MDFTNNQLLELLEVSRVISSTLDIDNILDKIITLSSKLLNTEASSLLLIDEPKNRLMFKKATGSKAEELNQFTLKLGEGIAGWVAQTGEALIVNDVTKDIRFRKAISETIDFPTKSILCVPIFIRDRIIGVIEVINKKTGDFDNQDLQLLSALSSQASISIENARKHSALGKEFNGLKQEIAKAYKFIGAKSEKTKELLALIDKVSQTDSTLLITGETGTGKEMVARMIHDKSKRAASPFTCVTCAILSETLLESELFGHEKGSFTGAATRKIGKFEAAHRGTVFLDEISSIPLSTQTKLLRVLQERHFERVGSTEIINVDIRVIAASNEKLEDLIKAGKFREDLYYRLKVIEISTPPLRERQEDIPEIANYYLKEFSRDLDKKIDAIAPETMKILQQYNWPGNIRELKNVIERAVVLGSGNTFIPEHLPLEIRNTSTQVQKPEVESGLSLESMEKKYIENTLKQTNGNKSQAAKILGISRNRLDRKIK